MGGRIILGEQTFPCLAPVLTWREHGMEFKAGRGARRQVDDIDLFVAHWTGGENSPPVMFRVLEKRKLAVEFAIGAEETTPGFSTVWQFCDPMKVDAFQAGPVNRRSMGCEIVNYGFRRLKNLGRIPRRGRDRETYTARWNGRKRTFARFRPHQIHTAIALIEAIVDSGMTEIELAIPSDPMNPDWPIQRVLTENELSVFRGVVGHNHVSRRKSDPGVDLMLALKGNGFDCRPVG